MASTKNFWQFQEERRFPQSQSTAKNIGGIAATMARRFKSQMLASESMASRLPTSLAKFFVRNKFNKLDDLAFAANLPLGRR